MTIIEKIKELHKAEMSYYQRWEALMNIVEGGIEDAPVNTITENTVVPTPVLKEFVKTESKPIVKAPVKSPGKAPVKAPAMKGFNSVALFAKSISGKLNPEKTILGNTRIQLTNGVVTLTQTIDHTNVFVWKGIPEAIECEGDLDVLVSTKTLKSILKTAFKVITLKDGNLYINREYLPSKNTEGKYPAFSDFSGESTTLKADELKKVVPYVSTPDSRRFVKGVLIDEDCIVATDGKRLAKLNYVTGFKDVILPVDFIKTMPDGYEVLYTKKDKNIKFTIGEFTMYSSVVEGNFPPYKAVIPTGYGLASYEEYKFPVIDGSKFEHLLNKDKHKVKFDNGTLKVGDYSCVVPEFSQLDMQIAMNWNFLKTASENCTTIKIKNPQSATLCEGDGLLVILMPMVYGDEE